MLCCAVHCQACKCEQEVPEATGSVRLIDTARPCAQASIMATVARLCLLTQRAMKQMTGYFAGYISKKQKLGNFELKSASPGLSFRAGLPCMLCQAGLKETDSGLYKSSGGSNIRKSSFTGELAEELPEKLRGALPKELP